VTRHAWRKAKAALKEIPEANGLLIAADTLVYFEGRKIGKPGSYRRAEATLRRLQGRWHTVYTGVALLWLEKGRIRRKKIFCERTRVRLKAMAPAARRAYFRRVHPLDKAGAYAIQDRSGAIVEELSGSFSNAVGLPMERLKKTLSTLPYLWKN